MSDVRRSTPKRWLTYGLLWDGPVGEDASWVARLVAARRPLIALLVSAWLTWKEWQLNHPPEIALIAVIHFIVVLLAIAVVVHLVRWLSRRR